MASGQAVHRNDRPLGSSSQDQKIVLESARRRALESVSYRRRKEESALVHRV